MKRPFLLFKHGEYWYNRLAEGMTFNATCQKSRYKPEAFVFETLRNCVKGALRRNKASSNVV